MSAAIIMSILGIKYLVFLKLVKILKKSVLIKSIWLVITWSNKNVETLIRKSVNITHRDTQLNLIRTSVKITHRDTQLNLIRTSVNITHRDTQLNREARVWWAHSVDLHGPSVPFVPWL